MKNWPPIAGSHPMKYDIGAIQQGIQSSIWSHRYIGNYEIVRKIGEGSFSSVYLAVHVMTRHEVVLKSSEKFQTNLASEIANMSLVSHPHIVRLYEYIVMPDKVWLVLEYCGGEELFNHLVMAKVILPEQANSLFAQLAGAVAYVHQLNCAHRDLKLENVLLDEYGNIKLGDFGFTRSYLPRTMLETICGTQSYMAPELLLRQKYNPEAADVWSLGVILYALIYGKLPFDEDDTVVTVKKIIEEDPPFPHVPKGEHLVEIARKMLRKHANQRPKVIDILDELKDAGKHQKQLLVKIMLHPESSYIFSSREERSVLKGMRALSIDLRTMASSIVNHKCDPLHGLWYTALDRQRILSKHGGENGNSSAAVRRKKSKASLRSSKSHNSQKKPANPQAHDGNPHAHDGEPALELSKAEPENCEPEIAGDNKPHASSPTPPDVIVEEKSELLSEQSQQNFHSEVHLRQQRAQAYSEARAEQEHYPPKTKPSVQTRVNNFIERRSVSKSRGAMSRLVSALKLKRQSVKDSLIAYYDPSLDKDMRKPLAESNKAANSTNGSSLTNGGAAETPRGATQNSTSSLFQAYRQVSSPVLDLGKGSPSSSRRHSTLSLASSNSIPFSDAPLKSNGSGTYGFVAAATLSSQNGSISSGQGSNGAMRPMSRQMSTYSQISQLSQLSQSSVDASQLLSETAESPLTSNNTKKSSPVSSRWPNSVLGKKFAGIAQPAVTSSPTSTPPGTPLMSRPRAGRLISVKEKIPSKIEEGDNENEW